MEAPMYGHDVWERTYRCGEYDGYLGRSACEAFLNHPHKDVRDGYRAGHEAGQLRRLATRKQAIRQTY